MKRDTVEEEVTEEMKRFTTQEMVRGFIFFFFYLLFEEVMLVFLGPKMSVFLGPRCRMLHEICSSRSECNPVQLCHI